jgi:hypothetical protein
MTARGDRTPQATGRPAYVLFSVAQWLVEALLLLSIAATIWALGWEYSTQRYLKGFADAIVPAAGSPEQKIQAILGWMAQVKSPIVSRNVVSGPDRNPIDTLNYKSLLRVCGTATNAFINLADTAGLSARRLLLLDAREQAKHVDVEVRVNGRWVVVDPVFRKLLEAPDGTLLTRTQLLDRATLAAATRSVPNYNPNYTFERTAHIRLARLGSLGLMLEKILNRADPAWQDSTLVSLLLERESLAAVIAWILIAMFLILLRGSLRWYGEQHLQVQPVRIRERFRRAGLALIDTQI